MDVAIFDVAVTFDLGSAPKELVITDNTPYAANGIPLADVVGVLTVTGPSGIFYNNTDFLSPDIDHDVSLIKRISLPLATDGNVEQGDYSVALTIQVTDEAFSHDIDAINQADGKFYIDGDYRADVLATSPGTVAGSTGNDGSYTVDAVAYNTTTLQTEIDTSTDPLPSAVADGTWDYTITKEYTDTTETSLNFTAPTGKIEMTFDCDCAKLTAEDKTAYGDYLSMTRTLTLNAPNNSGGSPVYAQIQTSVAKITSAELWTNVWNATLANTVVYEQDDGTYVSVSITATDSIEVACDDNICCIYNCINTINSRFLNALGENPQEAKRLKDIFMKMYGHWILYSIAKTCGNTNNKKTQFEAIKALVNAEDCDCCNSDADDYPVQVIPLCGLPAASSGNTYVVDNSDGTIIVASNTVGGTTTFTVSVNQSTVTGWINAIVGALTLDDLTDVTITTPATNEVLKYNGSVWVNDTVNYSELGDVTLTTIANGEIAVWVTANARWENKRAPGIIQNDQTDVATTATTGEEDLFTHTIAADTLSANGERIQVQAKLKKALNANQVTVRLKLGGTTLLTTYMPWANIDVVIEGYIERLGDNSQNFNGNIKGILGWNTYNVPVVLTGVTEDLTTNLDLKLTAQNSVASAGDGTGEYMISTFHPKYV